MKFKDFIQLIVAENILIFEMSKNGSLYLGKIVCSKGTQTVKLPDCYHIDDFDIIKCELVSNYTLAIYIANLTTNADTDGDKIDLSDKSAMSVDNNDVKTFKNITNAMAELYAKKNSNYGNSFTKLYQDLGPVAGLVPLHNKLDRLTNLVKGGKNDFESIEDTLIDLANYAIMNLLEIRRR